MTDLDLVVPSRRAKAARVASRVFPENPERFGALVLVVGFATVWEVAARAGALSPLLFPPPTDTAIRAWEMTVSGQLPRALGTTGLRLIRGLAIGTTLGLLVGGTAGWSARIRSFSDPIIALLHPIPKLAMLPFFMILLGIGDAPRVVVIALSSFFPMAISTMAAVRLVNPAYYEVAADHGASTWLTVRRVVLPASLPHVLAGARLAFNSALHVTIALELIGAASGIGSLIWFAWETLRVEQLYAAVIVLAVVGVVANHLLERIQNGLVPWATTNASNERGSTR